MTAQTKKKLLKAQQGFTLIELLVVIGILAILLAITLIAINPARQFAQANNTKRSSDVNAVLNAINQYMADNSGNLPANMPASTDGAVAIKSGAVGNLGDICASLVTKYLAALPADPTSGNGAPLACGTGGAQAGNYNSGYTVAVSASNNRITVAAPSTDTTLTQGGAIISVTR